MVNKMPAHLGAGGMPAISQHPPGNAGRRTSGFDAMPEELPPKIAAYLKGRDRLHFALLNQHTLAAVTPQLHSGRLAKQAEAISDLFGFRCLLGRLAAPNEGPPNTIGNLRYDLQPEPLMALAPRIRALPLHQQAGAQQSWEAAAAILCAHSAALSAEVAQQAQSKGLAKDAAQIRSFAQFRGLLGSQGEQGLYACIRNLRADLRVKPLIALAARIATFPQDEQPEAVKTFLAAAAEAPQVYRQSLAKLEEKAREPDGNADQLRIAACVNAVKSGEPVQDVLDSSGLADAAMTAMRTRLTAIAWGAAVKNGASVAAAAVTYELTDPATLSRARVIAGCDDLCCGEPIETVVRRYGVTDEGELIELGTHAVLAARNNAPDAAGAGGQAEDELPGLMAAARHVFKGLVMGGLSLNAVAARYGTDGTDGTDETDVDETAESSQADINAATADVRNGSYVADTAARYGITDRDDIAELERIAPSSSAGTPDVTGRTSPPKERLKAKL